MQTGMASLAAIAATLGAQRHGTFVPRRIRSISAIGTGRVRIGEHSGLRKLMRAANRGLVPAERLNIIVDAMKSAAIRAPLYAHAKARRRFDMLTRDALARQRGENLDGSPRRETVPAAPIPAPQFSPVTGLWLDEPAPSLVPADPAPTDTIARCKNADRYKAMRAPQCNGGNPCLSCRAKWDAARAKVTAWSAWATAMKP